MTKFPSEPKSRRAPKTSDSFDPRYKDVFLKGRLGAYSIEFPSQNEAIVFHMRAQQYRKAVSREGKDPALAALLYQTTIRRDARRLFIEPNDAQFGAILDQIHSTTPVVGADVPAMASPPATDTPVAPSDEERPSDLHPSEAIGLEELLQNIDKIGE